jgi:hypothetical protein
MAWLIKGKCAHGAAAGGMPAVRAPLTAPLQQSRPVRDQWMQQSRMASSPRVAPAGPQPSGHSVRDHDAASGTAFSMTRWSMPCA